MHGELRFVGSQSLHTWSVVQKLPSAPQHVCPLSMHEHSSLWPQYCGKVAPHEQLTAWHGQLSSPEGAVVVAASDRASRVIVVATTTTTTTSTKEATADLSSITISHGRNVTALQINNEFSFMIQALKTATLLASGVGLGLGLGFAFSIRAVTKVRPPRSLEEEAVKLWAEPEQDKAKLGKVTYFDAFSCPLAPAARAKAKDLDGADVARAFFRSHAFRAESLLWDGTGLGPYLAKRGALAYSEETYGTELAARLEPGSRYEWWQMLRYDSREAFLLFHSPGVSACKYKHLHTRRVGAQREIN